jgi:hypothetical protein
MESPLQSVLSQPTKPNAEPPSSSKAMLTRGGKITAYFTGQVLIIAIVVGFFVAIAAVTYFHDRLGPGILRQLGCGFMVWGIATLMCAVVIGIVPYFFFWKRDTLPRSRIP